MPTRYSNIVCFFDPRSDVGCKVYSEIAKAYPMIGSIFSDDNLPVKLPKKDSKQLIITLGGDGMMLRALHGFVKANVDIYGINLGSVGFMLNSYNIKNLLTKIDSAIETKLYPLEMNVKTTDGAIHSAIAFNEVSLLRSTAQTAKMSVKVNGEVRLKELSGDGVMVATAAGSTAYNAAAGGPIVPLNANILLLTPINPFRPRRLSSVLLARQSIISFYIIEPEKRPISAFADSHEIKNISVVQVYERSDIKMSILFDKDLSLDERILKEQFAT
jgi:NAD+ kinase